MPKRIEIAANQISAYKSMDPKNQTFLETIYNRIQTAAIGTLNHSETAFDSKTQNLFKTYEKGNYDFSRLNKPFTISINGTEALRMAQGTITDFTTMPHTEIMRKYEIDLDNAIKNMLENALPNANLSSDQLLKTIAIHFSQEAFLKITSESFNSFSIDGMRLNSFTKNTEEIRSVNIQTNASKTEITAIEFYYAKSGKEFIKKLSVDVDATNANKRKGYDKEFGYIFQIQTPNEITIKTKSRYVLVERTYQSEPTEAVLQISIADDSKHQILALNFSNADVLQPYVNNLKNFLKVEEIESEWFTQNTFLDWLQTRLPLNQSSLINGFSTTSLEKHEIDYRAPYASEKPDQAASLSDAEYQLLTTLNELTQKLYLSDNQARNNKVIHSISLTIFKFISDHKSVTLTPEDAVRYLQLLEIAIGLSKYLKKDTLNEFVTESKYLLVVAKKSNDTLAMEVCGRVLNDFRPYLTDEKIGSFLNNSANKITFFQNKTEKGEEGNPEEKSEFRP